MSGRTGLLSLVVLITLLAAPQVGGADIDRAAASHVASSAVGISTRRPDIR